MNRICNLVAATALAFFTFLMPAQAEGHHVVLKAQDGNFKIEGELVGYDASYYIIKSKHYGTMTLDVGKFTCIGVECPKTKDVVSAHAFTPQKIDFGIHGSNTIGAQLMPSIIEGYARKSRIIFEKTPSGKRNEFLLKMSSAAGKKVASIDLKTHGSSTSFTSLSDGDAQIGMSSRPVKSFEQDAFRGTGGKNSLRQHVIALDAILVIVSPSNNLSALTIDQISRIFAGEIKDWSEVGGRKGKINVYSRDRQSGTFDTFKSLALKPFGRKLKKNVRSFSSNLELSDVVSSDPRGIGMVGFAYERNSKAVSIKNQCGIKRAPTTFNVKTLEYPLTRKLFLYTTKKTNHPMAKKLLDYATSRDAQDIVSKAGFINRAIDYMSFNDLGDRLIRSFSKPEGDEDVALLKEFVTTFKSAKRLTTTFRFKPNSVFLESKSAEQILQLGRVLLKKPSQKDKVYLVGFSDSAGDFEQNRQIAKLRAQQVKNTIVESFGDFVDADRLVVKSFGELLPVDCNTTAEGRNNNRRVEVWLPNK